MTFFDEHESGNMERKLTFRQPNGLDDRQVDEMETGRCSCGLVFYSTEYALNHGCLGHTPMPTMNGTAVIRQRGSNSASDVHVTRHSPRHASGISVFQIENGSRQATCDD